MRRGGGTTSAGEPRPRAAATPQPREAEARTHTETRARGTTQREVSAGREEGGAQGRGGAPPSCEREKVSTPRSHATSRDLRPPHHRPRRPRRILWGGDVCSRPDPSTQATAMLLTWQTGGFVLLDGQLVPVNILLPSRTCVACVRAHACRPWCVSHKNTTAGGE